MATRAPHEAQTDSCTYEIDLPAPHDSVAALSDVCAQVLAFISSLSRDYIWHKQQFQLGLSPEQPAQQHRWLTGTTDVTDAVDDEWFIVWLLRRVTNEWHDAAVQIEDDDGEFLLIEAADALPNWVTPQNAANRVWIYRGRLHLIPLEHKSALPFTAAADNSTLNPSFDPDEDGFLDRATALDLVRNEAVDTLAPQQVQDAVWARIDGYPAKIREHHHSTLAYLPTGVALALSDSPSLIAEAVGAFYEREPGMLKAVNTMSRFPPAASSPSTPADSMSVVSTAVDAATSSSALPNPVLVPVRLTRPLYSQLILQRFYAPKPFLKAGWFEAKKGRDDERRREVGMKIACGFEMLYQLTAPRARHPTDGTTTFDSSDSRYRAYLKNLTEKGFFGEEVEGSEAWKEKEQLAREGWLRTKANRPTLSFAQRVDDAVARARAGPSPPLANRIADPASLSAADAAKLEDSEEWLSLDEQGLEDILSARSSRKTAGAMLGDSDLEDSDDDDDDDEEEEEGGDGMQGVEGGRTAQEKAEEKKARKAAKRLEAMAGKVQDFVEGRGAVSGALFDDEQDGEEDDSDDEDIDMPALSAEERAARMEKLVAALPVEQWGQKPEEVTRAAEAGVAAANVPPLETTGDTDSAVSKKPVREPKLTKNEYEGASDLEDESDDEDEAMMPEGEEGLGGSDVEGEEGPSVVNEEDVLDLGEEMDEFLKFATETLGLSESQYEKILQERRDRGAFVPGPAKEKKVNVMPSASSSSAANSGAKKKAHFATDEPSPAAATAAGNPPPPRERLRNPNLTDFDSLMEQMEKELAQARKAGGGGDASKSTSSSSAPTDSSAGPAGSSRQSRDPNRIVVDSLSDSEDDDDAGPDPNGDDLSAMDAELSQLLKGLTGGGDEGPMDYNLVKNFLDSFQSQGGFAGPAGNLAGRLGFPLPRDAPSSD